MNTDAALATARALVQAIETRDDRRALRLARDNAQRLGALHRMVEHVKEELAVDAELTERHVETWRRDHAAERQRRSRATRLRRPTPLRESA